jgi:PAS domain S-box-containing protein
MKNKRSFYLSIVLPSSLTIVLFIASIYMFIIPFFENAIMEDKKETIAELTNTAISLIQEYENEYSDSPLNLKEAQELAKERVAQIRYGSEEKDYFWIIDETPVMIMHPYRPELIGTDLNNYYDSKGDQPFVEAAKLVKEREEGFVDYMWQWKDDSTKVVPKLSSVKLFKPWGWIIGTGIYLDDVEEEINELKKTLLIISLIIALIIALILFYVVRQSLNIEMKRQKLTDELHQSRQKYKTLVEASNEGTLMFMDETIIFSNTKFRAICGHSQQEMSKKKLEDLFTTNWQTIQANFKKNVKSYSFETDLICSENKRVEVVLSVSKVDYANTHGYIFTTKEVTKKELVDREIKNINSEIISSLALMKQPITEYINPIHHCPADLSIQQTSEKMERMHLDVFLIKQGDEIIGIVSSNDISIKAVAKNIDLNKPITSIMSAPLVTISDSKNLHEAFYCFSTQKASHIVTMDEHGALSGIISYENIISLQHNSLSYLLHEIEESNTIEDLNKVHKKLPAIVHILAQSNEYINDTIVFASSVTDKISQKIIELGLEELGPAPCKFEFISVGSEGRKEQTFLTDQDNGLIYEDGFSKDSTIEYFLELSNFVADALNEVGYNYCKGGMMACNPKWCQPLSKWKEYFTSWAEELDTKSLMDASTFLDFRSINGNHKMSAELRKYVFSLAKSKNDFLIGLAEMTTNFKSPINSFGNLVGNDIASKNKTIDLKTISTPIVKYSRIRALKHEINSTNTTERLKQLYKEGHLSENDFKDINLAYNYVMKLRLRNQSDLIQRGKEPSNTIHIDKLSNIEKGFLKSIFSLINSISSNVVNEIKKEES